LPSWPGDDWHSVALAAELISSSATAMDKLALVTLLIRNLKASRILRWIIVDSKRRMRMPTLFQN
jgi:hypothetical protein